MVGWLVGWFKVLLEGREELAAPRMTLMQYCGVEAHVSLEVCTCCSDSVHSLSR